MSNFKDLTNQKFGKLTTLYRLHNTHKKGGVHWLCLCDCGNLAEVRGDKLRSGYTKSCGCSRVTTKHGKCHIRLYNIYYGMKCRCYNKNYKYYEYYGGRGIKVCDEWLNDFQVFYDWAINNGYKENLTIDRINTNGNYEPDNCCWVDRKQQTRNRRNTKRIEYHGEIKPLAEWCELLGFEYSTIYDRIYKLNWPIEKALELEE